MATQHIVKPFTEHINYCLSFFKNISLVSTTIHLFWLTGPLLLLVERTPADLWITCCGFCFLIRSYRNSDWRWLKETWVLLALAFFACSLVSSIFSRLPFYSLGEAIAWQRFPLFAIASYYWLGRDPRMASAMLAVCGLGMVLLCSILFAELIILGVRDYRLYWPYGDPVPGSYLAKVTMPVFVAAVAYLLSKINWISFVISMTITFSLAMSVFAGERMNLLLRLFALMLVILSLRPSIKKTTAIIMGCFLLLISAVALNPDLSFRYVDKTLDQVPWKTSSSYYKAMNSGVVIAKKYPILGLGVGNHRLLCDEETKETRDTTRCLNHPHNYYIQLAAETGVLGLLFGTAMLVAIFWKCFRARSLAPNNYFVSTAAVVPFVLFFPIQSTADFFGQWHNAFLWTGIAISLSSLNLAIEKPES